jgi:hypothetical protein
VTVAIWVEKRESQRIPAMMRALSSSLSNRATSLIFATRALSTH